MRREFMGSYDSSHHATGLRGDDEEFIKASKRHFEEERKRMERPIIINIFGGPGAGKSTTAASVFGLLKLHGVNAELITEFAKDLTWEDRGKTLDNQAYVWAKQYHRLWRVGSQVDVVVTDAPLLHSLIYGDTTREFKAVVKQAYNEFNNRSYYLTRVKKYEEAGRSQTEDEAIDVDGEVIKMLKNEIVFTSVEGNYRGINAIVSYILNELGILKTHSIQKILGGW